MKLILPLNNMMLQAGYKSAQYEKEWGWKHYGVDATNPSSRNIYGMGAGVVVAAGQDGATLTGPNSRLGNVVVIRYNGVELVDGTVKDIVCRMYHLDKINVKAGDDVDEKTVIGQYGNTGANTTGAHLHIEFDTDTKFPTLAPGVSIGKGKVINTAAEYAKAGGVADSTIDPAKVWNKGKGQTIASKWLGSWVSQSDLDIPVVETKNEVEELKAEIAKLKEDNARYEAIINKALYYIEEARKTMEV